MEPLKIGITQRYPLSEALHEALWRLKCAPPCTLIWAQFAETKQMTPMTWDRHEVGGAPNHYCWHVQGSIHICLSSDVGLA
eukprot:5422473-Amphidinium_carterae.4